MYSMYVKILFFSLIILQPHSHTRDDELNESSIFETSIDRSINWLTRVSSYGVQIANGKPPRPAETLFSTSNEISTLTADNFTLIYGRPYAHLILFYAIWCGHCKAFAPNYQSLASDIISWKSIIQMSSVNCADGYNTNICREQGVMAYPTLKFFPPYAASNDRGAEFIIESTTVDSMRSTLLHVLLQYIRSTSSNFNQNPSRETLIYPGNSYPSTWPDFMPINATSLSELLYLLTKHRKLSTQLDTRPIILIIEPYNSDIGCEIILDLASYQKLIKINRIIFNLANPVINELITSIRLNTQTVSLPLVVQVIVNDSTDDSTSSSQSTQQSDTSGNIVTFNGNSYKLIPLTNSTESLTIVASITQLNRTFLVKKIVSNFLSDVWIDSRATSHQVNNNVSVTTTTTSSSLSPEITTQSSVETTSTISSSNDIDDETIDSTDAINRQGEDVHIVDLHNALRYSLYQEILLHTNISSDQMNIIKRYLTLLNRYFPFTNENVRRFIRRMSQWSNVRNITTAESFQAIMKAGSEGFLPQIQSYITCRGSKKQYRGYPCALWILFHSLTIAEYKSMQRRNIIQHQVLPFMKDYINTFFTCRECSHRFNLLTDHLDNQLVYQNSSILLLWNIHNIVSKEIAGSANEDPFFPKQPYPSIIQCPSCYNKQSTDHSINSNNLTTRNLSQWNVDWNIEQVLSFLTNRYDRTRIIRKTFPNRAPYSSSTVSSIYSLSYTRCILPMLLTLVNLIF